MRRRTTRRKTKAEEEAGVEEGVVAGEAEGPEGPTERAQGARPCLSALADG